MALAIENLINVTVSLSGTGLPLPAFGIPLIIDTENVQGATALSPVVGSFTGLQGLTTAGFQPWNKAYKLAASLCAQPQRPALFKVASVYALSTGELNAVQAADPAWYACLLTSRTSANIQTVSGWVESADAPHLFFAESQDAAIFTSGASVLSILRQANRQRSAVMARKAKAQIQTLTQSRAYVASNSISLKVNGSTVGPVSYTTDNATTLAAVATAIQATTVCTASASGDTITITATDPLVDVVISDYAVSGGASQGTATVVTTQAGQTPADAALCSILTAKGFGQAVGFGQTLAGVAADALSQTEYGYAKAQGGNVYASFGGAPIVDAGSTSALLPGGAAPIFIDTVAGVDRLKATVESEVFRVLTPATGKLPFNQSGINAVAGALATSAKRFADLGVLEPFVVSDAITIPSIASVSANDKAARALTGVAGTFTGTGAIQSVAISIAVAP